MLKRFLLFFLILSVTLFGISAPVYLQYKKGLQPVLFMRTPQTTHFRLLDDFLAFFGLEGTILGSACSLTA